MKREERILKALMDLFDVVHEITVVDSKDGKIYNTFNGGVDLTPHIGKQMKFAGDVIGRRRWLKRKVSEIGKIVESRKWKRKMKALSKRKASS